MGLALSLPCNAHDFSILCIWQMFKVSLLCVFPRSLLRSLITRDVSFVSLNFSSCHFSFSSWLVSKSSPDSFCWDLFDPLIVLFGKPLKKNPNNSHLWSPSAALSIGHSITSKHSTLHCHHRSLQAATCPHEMLRYDYSPLCSCNSRKFSVWPLWSLSHLICSNKDTPVKALLNRNNPSTMMSLSKESSWKPLLLSWAF